MKSLWEFHGAADPSRVTLDHHGCGAAVRVAPVGILYRSDRVPARHVVGIELDHPAQIVVHRPKSPGKHRLLGSRTLLFGGFRRNLRVSQNLTTPSAPSIAADMAAALAAAAASARGPPWVDNEDWYEVVEAINHHRLPSFAEELAALRA